MDKELLTEILDFRDNMNSFTIEEQKKIIKEFEKRLIESKKKLSIIKLIDKINNL